MLGKYNILIIDAVDEHLKTESVLRDFHLDKNADNWTSLKRQQLTFKMNLTIYMIEFQQLEVLSGKVTPLTVGHAASK